MPSGGSENTRTDLRRLMRGTVESALEYLETADERPIAQDVSMDALVAAIGGPLPAGPSDESDAVEMLCSSVDPGLVVTNAGRYFGFVEGGVLPAALAVDWLASTWDQNPGFYALSPAAAAAEEVCRRWLCELFGLPSGCSAGFTTGAQLANLTGLAAGLRHVLTETGWDVDADGLFGAPRVRVVVGAERHATVDRALRFLGLGDRQVVPITADHQGRMCPDALREALDGGPTVVCAQAGNVNTGSVDPLREICEVAHERGNWVHVDGAFGLWAAASPALRHLVDGVELADSWATDGHKWPGVPYDCGVALCAHPESHRSAMTLSADYLTRTGDRDGADWTPESSRRARAFPLWAALRSLGRSGVAEIVERSCAQAKRFAELLDAAADVTVLNEVVLNQVLVRIGDDDQRTRAAADAVQASGIAWLGTTVRDGKAALRISVSDHATDDAAIAATVDAILAAAAR